METTTKYELRMLGARDIAPVATILSKIGLKEIKKCFNPEELKEVGKGNAEAVGLTIAFEIASVVLANYAKCQDDIFKFLASLSGMDKKHIEDLPLDTFAEMLIDVVKKEEFGDFFKVVSKLFK